MALIQVLPQRDEPSATVLTFKRRHEVKRLTVQVVSERDGIKKPIQTVYPGSQDTVAVNYITGVAFCGTKPPDKSGFQFFVPRKGGNRHYVCAKKMDGFTFARLTFGGVDIPKAAIEEHARSRKGYGEKPGQYDKATKTWFFPLTSRHAGVLVMDFTDEQEDCTKIHYRVRVAFFWTVGLPKAVPPPLPFGARRKVAAVIPLFPEDKPQTNANAPT